MADIKLLKALDGGRTQILDGTTDSAQLSGLTLNNNIFTETATIAGVDANADKAMNAWDAVQVSTMVVNALRWKQPVDIDINYYINGTTAPTEDTDVSEGEVLLLFDETTKTVNKIYTFTTGAWVETKNLLTSITTDYRMIFRFDGDSSTGELSGNNVADNFIYHCSYSPTLPNEIVNAGINSEPDDGWATYHRDDKHSVLMILLMTLTSLVQMFHQLLILLRLPLI